MLDAALWGLAAASSLLVGMLAAFVWSPSKPKLGFILAFGAGALFSAIAFDLVDGALENGGEWMLSAGMLAGAGVYVAGSYLLRSRTSSGIADEDENDSRSIVLGATLDGIPESLAIGASLAVAGGDSGAMSLTLPVAVALSNLPEALGATVSMRDAGHRRRGIVLIWTSLVAASALASAIGYAVLSRLDEVVGSNLDAFTAGAVLAMVADTMVPDAYRDAGRIAGVATVLGFAVSFLLA
ncbi:MAG: hypothetical protein JWL76_1309 [Thermoleophilia bacterium]|nr:hypothetical protein [Thermoleophilia bacterium]